MEVPVKVVVNDNEPSVDHDSWDHAVQCDINAPSGKIIIIGCYKLKILLIEFYFINKTVAEF